MNTISAQAVLVSTAKDGVKRLHRPTCKRVSAEAVSVESLLEEGKVGGLSKSTPASCCKPSATLVAEVHTLATDAFNAQLTEWSSEEPDAEADDDQAVAELMEQIAEEADAEAEAAEDGDAPETAEEPAEVTPEPETPAEAEDGRPRYVASLVRAKALRYLWRAYKKGALEVAERFNVEKPVVDNAAFTLTFVGEDAEAAATTIEGLWATTNVALKAWRKANAEYQSWPKMGNDWYTSQRFLAEEAYAENRVVNAEVGVDAEPEDEMDDDSLI